MGFPVFHFKRCSITQEEVAHPVGTDGVLLGAWADVSGARHILDIGTGTGVVCLMLAQRTEQFQEVLLDAVEMHSGSARCAAQNFAASPWAERLRVWEMSVQAFAPNRASQYDLIVSNPPFFTETTMAPDETRRLGRHTATLSQSDLLLSTRQMLAPGGRFCVILPVKEGRKLCELSVPLGLYCTREVAVQSRREKPVERLLLQFERDPYRFRREALLIHENGMEYSIEYQALTADFYL